jgi:hypothetical protein
MTQANYYLTSHPGSPERRKALYGEPKPRDYMREYDKINDVDRKILKKIEVEKKPKPWSWQTAKIKWKLNGITYNGIKSAMAGSGFSDVTIMNNCRKPNGNFEVIGHQIELRYHKSMWTITDTETGAVYKSARAAELATGIRRKLIYNNPRFVRVQG